VFYENRALERRFQTTSLPLVPQGAGARDVSAPAEDRDPVISRVGGPSHICFLGWSLLHIVSDVSGCLVK